MKIGIVCPYNIFRYGGVQETVQAHRKILASRGHQSVIVTPRPIGYEGPVPAHIRLVGRSTDINYPFKTKADISFQAGRREIANLLNREKFDILHFHEPWVPLFPRQLLSQSTAINVATFHAKWPERFLYRTIGRAMKPYARSILNDLDYIAAASEPASHYINHLMGRSVPIIFVGVDLKHYNPAKINPLSKYNDQIKTILYIGRLEKRKGPDHLLHAYRILCTKRSDLRLVIASDGDMRSSLEQYVAEHKLPRVEFLGFVNDTTKLRLYASADVYCAPSMYGEGFGVVLLEAMAMRVPFVGGDNVGYRYATGSRANDYLVDPQNHRALAKKITKMIDDKDSIARYKKWSRKHSAKYDYGKIVDRYEKVYDKLIETRRHSQ